MPKFSDYLIWWN